MGRVEWAWCMVLRPVFGLSFLLKLVNIFRFVLTCFRGLASSCFLMACELIVQGRQVRGTGRTSVSVKNFHHADSSQRSEAITGSRKQVIELFYDARCRGEGGGRLRCAG